MLRLLDLAETSDGVRIFIGAESGLFGAAGVSMVVAPARNAQDRIVGAIGVIGPNSHQLRQNHPGRGLYRPGNRANAGVAKAVLF